MVRPVDWLRRAGLVTLTPVPGLESIVAFVAGKNAPAKWWSHPKGSEIYNLFRALASHPSVLSMKLVEGKVTLVHQRLWPALLCLAEDPKWRSRQKKKVSPSARALLRMVERRGSIRLDFLVPEWPGGHAQLKKDRTALERSGLVVSHDEHTESGTHQAVIKSWAELRKCKGIHAPLDMDREEAQQTLREFTKGRKYTLQ